MGKTRRGLRKKIQEIASTGKSKVGENIVEKQEAKKDDNELKEKVMEKLSMLSDRGDLTFGYRSLLRSLMKDSCGLVVLSQDIDGILYQTVQMLCLHNNVPFLSLSSDQLKSLKPKISHISAVSVRQDIVNADGSLLTLVNAARKAKKRSCNSEEVEKANVAFFKCRKLELCESISDHAETDTVATENFNAECYPYLRKESEVNSNILSLDAFIPLSKTASFCHDGFPDYDMSPHLSQVVLKVEDTEGVADLSKLMED